VRRHAPVKKRIQIYGQHFLHHKPTIDKIIKAVSLEWESSQPKTLLEVGPGKLALTQHLVKFGNLILVEKDKILKEFIESHIPNIETHWMDAASLDFVNLIQTLKLKNQTPILVVSNLPYSAASQILAKLCTCSQELVGCIVMVQKEVALRMIGKENTKARGAFSLLIQSYFNVKKLFDVSPGVFTPPPKVKSTVLLLKPILPSRVAHVKNPLDFEQFCKGLFSQRRKMIRNFFQTSQHIFFPKLGLFGTERPEDLKLETLIELYQYTKEAS